MLPGQFSVGIGKTMKDISHGCPMFTIPAPVAVQPRAVVQVMVYSQWSPTRWIPEIAGVASHAPQETTPFAKIVLAVGVTPSQMVKATEVGTHTVSMFTMPVAVAEQPMAFVQVMVYSQ
jgi:hypothetical protein